MSSSDIDIGWIGCGRMGTAMSTRLISAGNHVVVTNRTPSKAEALGLLGATVAANPEELAGCAIVFVMVAADDDVLDVTVGPGGVLSDPTLSPSIVIDCSTVSVETSARVRAACLARGTQFLAAPVSGNPKVVASGQLTLAVSGEREAFDQARPYLLQLGQGVTYVGPDEAARLVKICHNMFLGAMFQSLAEIVVLAERGGIKRSALLEFINNSILGSPFTRYKSPAFVNLDYSPTFTTTLLLKDFRLGMDAAKATGVSMPVAALCTELVASAIGAGFGGDDFAVLLSEQARSAGLTMAAEQASTDDGLSSR
jgi:3-hydroxyisobutyrate dehydrogenase-like beta-hydroxyacid dehydrogenase